MNLPITLKLCGFKKTKFWREGVQDLGLGCPSSGSLTYLLSGCGWGLQAPEVQFSRSVVSDSLQPHDTARQASLSITNSRSLLKLMSIESVMPSSHLILCCPLLLLPSIPPSIRVFSNRHPAVSTIRMAGSHACRQEASVLHRLSLSTGCLVAWHSSGGELGSDLERGGESKSLWTDFKPCPPSRTPSLPFLSFSLFFFFLCFSLANSCLCFVWCPSLLQYDSEINPD